MDDEYFKSITLEMKSLQNRVRHLIGDAHWLSDGEWKESILRLMLKRNLPQSFSVGRGFVKSPKSISSQIDVLLYKNDYPVLHRDGDFVLVTPDAVAGIIEVKTNLNTTKLIEAINKILDISDEIFEQQMIRPFVGVFSYDCEGIDFNKVFDCIENRAINFGLPTINAICLGESIFIRYWDEITEKIGKDCYWRAYPTLNQLAPAYFLHNVLEYLCESDYFKNVGVWYPKSEKEEHGFEQRKRKIN